eukprot:scaffold2163_cov120-Isochrysis_galbana.AAC.6
MTFSGAAVRRAAAASTTAGVLVRTVLVASAAVAVTVAAVVALCMKGISRSWAAAASVAVTAFSAASAVHPRMAASTPSDDKASWSWSTLQVGSGATTLSSLTL